MSGHSTPNSPRTTIWIRLGTLDGCLHPKSRLSDCYGIKCMCIPNWWALPWRKGSQIEICWFCPFRLQNIIAAHMALNAQVGTRNKRNKSLSYILILISTGPKRPPLTKTSKALIFMPSCANHMCIFQAPKRYFRNHTRVENAKAIAEHSGGTALISSFQRYLLCPVWPSIGAKVVPHMRCCHMHIWRGWLAPNLIHHELHEPFVVLRGWLKLERLSNHLGCTCEQSYTVETSLERVPPLSQA